MTTFDVNSNDRDYFAYESTDSVVGDTKLIEILLDLWDDEEDNVFYRGLPCTVTEIERSGGSEQGNSAEIIFSIEGEFVPNGKAIYRVKGSYSSHYGFDWDGPWSQVEPYEKTITRYREVK